MNRRQIDAVPATNSKVGECYFDHFVTYFGNPTERFTLRDDQNRVIFQVGKFVDVFDKCELFATLGVSKYTQDQARPVEVCVPIAQSISDMPDIVGTVLHELLAQNKPILWGQILEFGSEFPDFVQSYEKVALYLAQPFGVPDDFWPISCSSTKLDVLFGIFLTRQEVELRRILGMTKLESLLEKANVDVLDLQRKSAI